MTEAFYLVGGVLAGGLLGWMLAWRLRGGRIHGDLSGLLGAVQAGRVQGLDQVSPGEPDLVRELRETLAKGWVPRGLERDEATREALKRLAAYLRHRVEAPLLEGLDGNEAALRSAADEALDAVEDLEFFLEDPPIVPVLESRNLVDLVGEVTREFAGQFTIYVKVDGPQAPLRVNVDPEPLKDAIFLLLHNAGEFGGGAPVHMTLCKEEDRVRIVIRDQGPGFTPDALLKAMDPFYTTSPGGLGLGLPYARMAIKAQGGEVVLRNAEGGGGEVQIVLPQRG
ncbi:MAG: sensor histidine kinase [Longimicrobiales bacterium]